ncbi:hypothetical protein EST38_g9753 [Candolleomyces aberdarensis]|uniref:Uncharacterized protein n=1 Tax=Candolleomyces aberdarensis TaxID=2316362 RepID=A0A4Q2D943_9AGAR|nr:hypothetical protein EST38_g9753 [Candolleomyces aberdarensis]
MPRPSTSRKKSATTSEACSNPVTVSGPPLESAMVPSATSPDCRRSARTKPARPAADQPQQGRGGPARTMPETLPLTGAAAAAVHAVQGPGKRAQKTGKSTAKAQANSAVPISGHPSGSIEVQAPKVPRRRRTKAEIAAEAKAKADAKDLQSELQQRLEDRVAEAERNEATLMAQTRAQVVRRLGDTVPPVILPNPEPTSALAPLLQLNNAAVCESESEKFNLDVSDGSDEDDLGLPEHEDEIAKLRAQIERLKLKSGAGRNTKGKGKSKKGLNTLPLASVLWTDFQVPAPTDGSFLSVNPVGGLNDDDIFDTRPSSGFSPQRGSNTESLVHATVRNPSRLNKLVGPARLPTAMAHLSVQPASQYLEVPGSIVRAASAPTATKSSKKRTSALSEATTVPLNGTQVAIRLTTTNVEVEHLPTFAKVGNKWRVSFLPTLYHVFYISTDPFKNFMISTPALVGRVQQLVDLVYPEVAYEVQASNEPFHLLSYNRINERRGLIAKSALDVVSKHVVSTTFSNNRDRHDWLMWACRLDGPLFFEEPTPAWCKGNRGDEDYIEPSGRFKSHFIVKIAQKALSFSKNAAVDALPDAPPVGLFALIMLLLERAAAFIQVDGSVSKDIKPFSYKIYGEALDQYIEVVGRVSHERWREILALCAVPVVQARQDPFGAGSSAASVNRREMFSYESPKKRH